MVPVIPVKYWYHRVGVGVRVQKPVSVHGYMLFYGSQCLIMNITLLIFFDEKKSNLGHRICLFSWFNKNFKFK